MPKLDFKYKIPTLKHKLEVIKSIEGLVTTDATPFMLPPEKVWHPNEFLPDLTREDWREQIAAFREPAKGLPDDVLVVLVGSTITEEALPNYQTAFNRHEGIKDKTGSDPHIWARWSRAWTAEEKRHGDVLNRYLYLTGKVDMAAVELTVHNLIRNGFDAQTEDDPYYAFVYTSFQEKATQLAHRVTAKMAEKFGDKSLAVMCNNISGDEGRHGAFYKGVMKRIFEVDPKYAIVAYATMMDRDIVMPIRLMADGIDDNLFRSFSEAAQHAGIHTGKDYKDITEELNEAWDIANIKGLSGKAAKAQDYLCGLPKHQERLAERLVRMAKKYEPKKFSWIFNREA